MRIFTWHVHGHYPLYLSQLPHEIFIPVKPGGRQGYGGRAGPFPWPDNLVEVEAGAVADLDCNILAVNLRGPFLLSKLVLPHMVERGSGYIVNIASTAAKRAWASAAAYHASKWGLLGFTHALHVEARVAGVKVTAVVAGGMRTPSGSCPEIRPAPRVRSGSCCRAPLPLQG